MIARRPNQPYYSTPCNTQIKVKTLKEAAVELAVTGATTVGELKALIEQSACVHGCDVSCVGPGEGMVGAHPHTTVACLVCACMCIH